MVTNMQKVLKQVASAREHVAIEVDPFFDEHTTLVTIGVCTTDNKYKDTMIGFESALLMVITDKDLKDYMIEQIDRVAKGLPIQNIRVKRN